MKLDIITPEKILFSGPAGMVMVPGALGDFGVLPGHAPCISAMRPGVITVETGSGRRRIAVTGGIAEANPDACIILAESAEECTDWSAAEIEARRAAARDDLAHATTDARREAAEKKLALAEALPAAA